jgi:hypothetical protein
MSAREVRDFLNSFTFSGSALVFLPSLSLLLPSSSMWNRKFSRSTIWPSSQKSRDNRCTVFLFGNCLFDFGTDAVMEEQDFAVKEFLQFFSNWFQRIFFRGFAIRSTEVGHQSDCFCFMVNAVLDGWQCSDDALIVCDFVWSSLLLWNLSRVN